VFVVTIESRMSLRDIVGEVADDARSLVRGEISLARAELEKKTDKLLAGGISLFAAMMLASVGLVLVLIALAQLLARVMPDWGASLVVGAIALAIGVAMALSARRALAPSGLVPDHTIHNVQADARTVKEHAA
jgi:uncharacterized membrane protein YqjE